MLADLVFQTQQRTCSEHGPYEARYIALVRRWTACPACVENSFRRASQQGRASGQRPAQQHVVVGDESAVRLQNCSMQHLHSTSQMRQAVYERLHRYVQRHELIAHKGIWALLAGLCGTGKTYAMAAMARALASEHRLHVLLLRASDVIERGMAARKADVGSRADWIVKPAFVFIDECTPAACEHPAFFDALDARYLARKPVVFAGNAAVTRQSDAAIAASVLGERLGDRLFDGGGQVLRFAWPSLRTQNQEEPLF